MTRAATQLGVALQHLEAARQVRAPLLFGRNAAVSVIETELDQGASWVRTARWTLGNSSSNSDARLAVDHLAQSVAKVRDTDPAGVRNSVALLDAMRAARAVHDEFAPAVGAYTTPGVSAVDAQHDVLLAAAREGVGATRRVARDELRRLASIPGDQVTRDDLLLLARLEDEVGRHAFGMPAPHWRTFRSLADSEPAPDPSTIKREVEHVSAWLRISELEDDPSMTVEMLRSRALAILLKPMSAISAGELVDLSALTRVSGSKSLGVAQETIDALAEASTHKGGPRSTDHGRLAQLRTDLLSLELQSNPAYTRETITAVADAILAKADVDVTVEDVRDLAVLGAMTGPKSINVGFDLRYDLWREVDGSTPGMSAVFDAIRRTLARDRLEADPAITRIALRDQVFNILAKPDEAITSADLSSLSVIRSVRGAPALGMPEGASIDLGAYASHGAGGTEHFVKLELLHLRAWRDAEAFAVDGSLSRAHLRDMVGEIVYQDPNTLTSSDIRRLAAAALVRGEKNVGLGDMSLVVDRWYAKHHGQLDDPDPLKPLRAWGATNSDAGFARLIERLRAGSAVTGPEIDALNRRWADVLSAALKPASIMDQLVLQLRSNRSHELSLIRSALTVFRDHLDTIDVDPTAHYLRSQTIDLATRNIDRLDHRIVDTYPGHPDYAELGRIETNIETLMRFSQLPTRAPLGTTRTASRPGEALIW